MKTVKLIFILIVSLAFLNGCSNEQTLIIEQEETKSILNVTNKTSDWSDNDSDVIYHDNEIVDDDDVSTSVTYILVEYVADATKRDRARVINDYSEYVGLLYTIQCPNDVKTEIWVVDAEIYYCQNCAGGPKSATIEGDSEVERAFESSNCDD